MRLEGGAITQNYEDTTINSIIISTTAKDGSAHSFLIEEVGDLIQLFDIEDKNYGLFEIEAIDTASSTEYVFFTVKWLQGLGETHVDDDVLIKTFAPPTGGTASEFLPLVGGVMLGEVEWNKTDSADTPFRHKTDNKCLRRSHTSQMNRNGRMFSVRQYGRFVLSAASYLRCSTNSTPVSR